MKLLKLWNSATFKGVQIGLDEETPSFTQVNCDACGSTVSAGHLGHHTRDHHPELSGEEPRRAWLLRQAAER